MVESQHRRRTKPDKSRHHVAFGAVEIREFPIILGDNPAITSGAPISIDWEPQHHQIMNIDIYEYCRTGKPKRKLQMSEKIRDMKLKAAGFTQKDIEQAAYDAQKIRKSRESRVSGVGWSALYKAFSMSTKGFSEKKIRKLIESEQRRSLPARMA